MKLPKFKIRDSAIGKIMVEPRSIKDREAGVLAEGVKTYVDTWIKEQIYKRRIDFSNKYTKKGIAVEHEAVELAAKHLGWQDYHENMGDEKKLENEWSTGHFDVDTKESIEDIKASWDISTFPLNDKELKKKDYEWQVLSYMWKANKKKGGVVYALMNTPEFIIESEYQKRKIDISYEEFKKNFIFDQFPLELRIKRFPVEYNEEKIQQIINRVEQIRNYITNDLGYEFE